MDYIAALKTVLTLVGLALVLAFMVEFPIAIVVIMGSATISVIVAVIYMGFTGDLPEL